MEKQEIDYQLRNQLFERFITPHFGYVYRICISKASNGLTGAAMKTIDYIPERGQLEDWGDNRANRSDRFLAAVAYLDGVHPVSYTHLDVYKRQALASVIGGSMTSCSESFLDEDLKTQYLSLIHIY